MSAADAGLFVYRFGVEPTDNYLQKNIRTRYRRARQSTQEGSQFLNSFVAYDNLTFEPFGIDMQGEFIPIQFELGWLLANRLQQDLPLRYVAALPYDFGVDQVLVYFNDLSGDVMFDFAVRKTKVGKKKLLGIPYADRFIEEPYVTSADKKVSFRMSDIVASAKSEEKAGCVLFSQRNENEGWFDLKWHLLPDKFPRPEHPESPPVFGIFADTPSSTNSILRRMLDYVVQHPTELWEIFGYAFDEKRFPSLYRKSGELLPNGRATRTLVIEDGALKKAGMSDMAADAGEIDNQTYNMKLLETVGSGWALFDGDNAVFDKITGFDKFPNR